MNGLYTGSSESGPGGRPRDPCYHLPCDQFGNVDPEVLLRMARATVRALGRVGGVMWVRPARCEPPRMGPAALNGSNQG